MLEMFCLECRDKVLQRGSETCFSPCPIAEADDDYVAKPYSPPPIAGEDSRAFGIVGRT